LPFTGRVCLVLFQFKWLGLMALAWQGFNGPFLVLVAGFRGPRHSIKVDFISDLINYFYSYKSILNKTIFKFRIRIFFN
jgi:hypothetical protein